MERIALRAEYRTDNIFNEGYICISKDGDEEIIEGIFGTDYLKLDFIDESTLHLLLCETVVVPVRYICISVPFKTAYESYEIYHHEISCPDEYYFENDRESLSLCILSMENSPEKIETIFNLLDNVRPQPLKKQL